MTTTQDDIGHAHDVACLPCERCKHLTCSHDQGFGECHATGCVCEQWLAYGDCPDCNGTGYVVDPDTDMEKGCWTCGRSGTWWDHGDGVDPGREFGR